MGHGCHACGCPNGCECEEIEDQRRSGEILKRLTALIGREARLVEELVKLKRKASSHGQEVDRLKARLEHEVKERDSALKEWDIVGEKLNKIQLAHSDTYDETRSLIEDFKIRNL